MKNIFKKFAVIAVLGFVAVSCGDEPFDIEDGGSLGENILPPSSANFLFGGTPSLEFDLNPTANGIGITSIVAKKQLFTSLGDSDVATVTTNGTSFGQSLADLFADVPVGGTVLTEADLLPGDKWEVYYEMMLSDGRLLRSPYETTINFSCPSEIALGTYAETATGTGTGVEVILTEPEEGYYNISQMNFNYYSASYAPVFGEFTDICNILSLQGIQVGVAFDIAWIGAGSYDPVTGNLSFAVADATYNPGYVVNMVFEKL